MPDGDVRFLNAEQARYLVERAEDARARLSQFAGYQVLYNATAIQLLDEWIEQVVQKTPQPGQGLKVLWFAFLGEAFRRRFEGEWVVCEGDGQALAVLCPAEGGGLHVVEVARQVQLRISRGFSESLALFYMCESILLKESSDL